MKLIALILFTTLSVYSQYDRNFRPYHDDYGQVIAVKIGNPENEMIWMLNDVNIIEEKSHLLNLESQDSMKGVGIFVNPVINRGLFNYSASKDICPFGWRIPRIGEWDTLTLSLTFEQLTFMFPNPRGFVGYSLSLNDSTIIKKTQNLKGGYWWTSDSISNRLVGMELTGDWVWREGFLNEGDFAGVRCIKSEDEE
jgi:uncharacterized protein (TIGR02145 family)